MAKAEKSIFALMDEVETAAVKTVSPEVAATAEQQQLMERAGELEAVHYIGPNGKLIPGFYSNQERAFLPRFKID